MFTGKPIEVFTGITSGVSRGVFWLSGTPPTMIFLNQGVTPLLAPTLTGHLHLRRSETPLQTNSGYATDYIEFIEQNHIGHPYLEFLLKATLACLRVLQ